MREEKFIHKGFKMKFYIDDKEIKTINKNSLITGGINLVSRSASFSYLYMNDFGLPYAQYKSSVLIKNDENETIFRGSVVKLNYSADKKTIEVEAKDPLYFLLETKIKGRYKGNLIQIMAEILGGFNISFALEGLFLDELNIISLGGLSAYDVIKIAVSKIFGDNFKIYLDSMLNLKILIPSILNSKAELIIGKNVISAEFAQSESDNVSKITALNNDDVISGSIVKVVEQNKGIEGYFLVESDVHNYSSINTMTLNLKEWRV